MANLRELSWELSTKGVSKVSKDTKNVNKQFDGVKTNIKDIDLGAKSLGKNLKNSFKEINATLQSASSGLKNFGKDLKSKGEAISKFGGKITKATLPLTALGTAGLKMSLDLDKGIRQISTLTDENILPIAQVRKEIRAMSDETGIAQKEIAESVYEALSSDVDQKDVMKFVRSGIDLTKAGFTDMATVVDATTTVLNAYGDQAADINKIHDIFVMTQDKGKITVDELGASIGRVIPTASAAGVSLEQLGASYSMLTAKGQNPQIATTNLNALLAELSVTGGKADKTLRKKTGKGFKELTKEGNSLGDVLEVLDQGAKDTGLSLGDMFGRSGGMAALTLISEGKDAYNEMVGIMDNATGATAANAEKMAGPGQKMQIAWTKMKNTLIDVGDIAVPAVLPLVEGVSSVATAFSDLDPQLQSTIVEYGLLAIAAGPVISSLGGIVTGGGILIGAFGTLLEKTAILSKGAGVLKFAIGALTSPFGLFTAGVGIAIAVGGNLIRNWDRVKQKASDLGGGIVGYLLAALNVTGEGFMNLLNKASNALNGIKDKWEGVKNFLKNPIKGTISFVENTIAKVSGKGNNKADGSHATGLNYVPKDDYKALLHPGEMVLTRKTSDEFRSLGGTKDNLPDMATNTSYTDVGASSAVFSPVVNITIEGNADENTVKEIDSAIDSRMAYWFRKWNLQMG